MQPKTYAGQLHHVEIYVSDLSRSREFWGWFLGILGYVEFQSWDEGVSYKLHDTYIVFVQTTEKYLDIDYHRCRTGLNHLAFHATSQRQVDELNQQLSARGITRLYNEKYPHAGGPDYYALFFEDPDRIKVELVAPDEPQQN